MQFLNPALLAGALLFAVPLLIHLLNRQRHKRRPWAAMDFLLRAFQKQRNRLRNENLLLLLLRCLIPILLALAIARPLMQEAAALLAGGGTVHHVFVVDGSYSMGLRQDGAQSPYERARALVGRMLDRFEQNPNRNDKVTLVDAGVRTRFVVRGDLDVGAARAGWSQMTRPDDGAGDLTEALSQVADALDEAKDPAIQVYVFTDLQARAMGEGAVDAELDDGPVFGDTLRDLVADLQTREGLDLHWIDTGPMSSGQGGEVDNVQVTAVRLSDPAAVQKTPAEVLVTLRNLGTQSATAEVCLLYTSPSPRDVEESRMPSSA